MSVLSVKNEQLERLHEQVMMLIDRQSVLLQEQQQKLMNNGKLRTVLMRFTARLHQMAYLLMLVRAEHDGDMKPQDAARERAKILIEPFAIGEENLPENFRLLEQHAVLLARQLDYIMPAKRHIQQTKNMPQQQLKQIEAAFTLTKATR